MLTPTWRRRHRPIDWRAALDALCMLLGAALLAWAIWSALASARAPGLLT